MQIEAGQNAQTVIKEADLDRITERSAQVLNREIKPNLTSAISLQAQEEKLDLPAVGLARQQLQEAYESIERTRERLRRDPTATPAAKVLKFAEAVTVHKNRASASLDSAARGLMQRRQQIEEKLFSGSAKLEASDYQALPIFLEKISAGEVSLSGLVEKSPREAALALEIAKAYPSLVPQDEPGFDELRAKADRVHTPEAYEEDRAISEALKSIEEAAKALQDTSESIVPGDLLKTIQELSA